MNFDAVKSIPDKRVIVSLPEGEADRLLTNRLLMFQVGRVNVMRNSIHLFIARREGGRVGRRSAHISKSLSFSASGKKFFSFTVDLKFYFKLLTLYANQGVFSM